MYCKKRNKIIAIREINLNSFRESAVFDSHEKWVGKPLNESCLLEFDFKKITLPNGYTKYCKQNIELDSEFNLVHQDYEGNYEILKKIEFVHRLQNLFYEMTKLYLQENELLIDNWVYENWDLAKYFPKNDSKYAMAYHTDFQREQADAPGNKFGVTAVFYLNDNYTGGEVCYRFFDGNDYNTIVEDFSYKPTAGDVAIFLSGHPHYHGVKSVTEGEKYIIRTYWRYHQEGSPVWKSLEEKYGTEAFLEMEKARRAYMFENNQSVNDILVFPSIEEYYNKLQNNEL